MKSIYLSLFLFIVATTVNCQNNKPDSAEMPIKVKQEAQKMAEFVLHRDANALIDFHPPKVIQGVGGKQKFIEATEKIWQDEDANGLKLMSDSIGDPSNIIYFKNVYQCTISQTMIYSYNEKKKYSIEYPIIAISYDGEKWYFIDTKGDWGYINIIFEKFPELSTELSFPENPTKIQTLDK